MTDAECALSVALQFMGQALYAQLFAVMSSFVRHASELIDNFRAGVQQALLPCLIWQALLPCSCLAGVCAVV